MKIDRHYTYELTPSRIQYGNSYEVVRNSDSYRNAVGKVRTVHGLAYFDTAISIQPGRKDRKYMAVCFSTGGVLHDVILEFYAHSQRSAVTMVRRVVDRVVRGDA